MGCWGMGMTQSDEFCEIYDRFMDSYNEGKEVSEITADILSEYQAEFDDDDGVMHDVYFALAKAEWMCCEQSEAVLNRVKEIIESGANIEFYRELEAGEKDLKIRQKKLEKFFESLQTPRAKPRQRRIDPLDRVKELPPLDIGDCYRYKYGDGYRVFVVLGFNKAQGWRDMMRCGIFQKTYSTAELKTTNFLNEELHSILCYLGEELLAPSSIKKIATISVPEGIGSSSLSGIVVKQGSKKGFKAEFTSSIATTPASFFGEQKACPKFKKGDVIAYKTGDKYRVFCLVSFAPIANTYASYCYVWTRFFDEIPTIESIVDDYVLPLGYFTMETLPSIDKLTLIGNYPDVVSEVGGLIYPHFINPAWRPATIAMAKEENLSETIPFELCMKLSDVLLKLNELRATAQQNSAPKTDKGEKEMFGFKKKTEKNKEINFDKILDTLCKNQISITTKKVKNKENIYRSKFGGNPAVPTDFEWPSFEAENYDGETANRPLSFMCQINLDEVSAFDMENMLPKSGLLLFFYEQESMCWGFDPKDAGCSRVYYFEDISQLVEANYPDDLLEEYRVKEFDLSFEAQTSYPSFEELECHYNADVNWDCYDEAVSDKGYEMECERHKLLGYADLIQGEMLSECERTSRDIYCGDAESYNKLSEDEKEDIKKSSSDWILLFQMASIQDDDYELMFGDVGNLYFYIRKQDLKNQNFHKVWLVSQCG